MSLESLYSITSLARVTINSSVRLLKGSLIFPYKAMLLKQSSLYQDGQEEEPQQFPNCLSHKPKG